MGEAELRGWFAGRVPEDWFSASPEVSFDREEILIVGTLPAVKIASDVPPEQAEATRAGRIRQFREETREARVRIAAEGEHRFGRKVSWGAVLGDRRELFTTASVPIMTRLRMADRKVLDTLVDAGIPRSRSDALGWCVRLVGTKQSEWLGELRDALTHVEKARAGGPAV